MYTTFHSIRLTALVAIAAVSIPTSVVAQDNPVPEPTASWSKRSNYSGPRFGVTYLPPAIVDSLERRGINVGPVITQFGWQFEREFYSIDGGPKALNEWLVLVGGLESGQFLPSLSWIVGIRGQNGFEVGVGPNVTAAGVALAAATGVNVRRAGMNFPLNLAVVSSASGVRASALVGFTLR